MSSQGPDIEGIEQAVAGECVRGRKASIPSSMNVRGRGRRHQESENYLYSSLREQAWKIRIRGT